MKEAINQRFIDAVFFLIETEKDLNKSKIASIIDIQPSKFSEILNKRMNVGVDTMVLFCEKFRISVEWLLTGQGSMLKAELAINNVKQETGSNIFKLKTDNVIEHQPVPLYDIQATASVVALFKDSNNETPIDHITIPNLPKCDGAIYVSGDSMYPLLKSGDIIMYKKVGNVIDNMFWGEMYLVSLINDDGDEFIMVKWLHKSELGQEYVKLVSENRHHQPKDFHIKNIKGLALIKASVRINSMF